MNDYIVLLLYNICLSIGTANVDREIHLLHDAISRLSHDTQIMQRESGLLRDDYTLTAAKIGDIESKVKLGDSGTVNEEWKAQSVSPVNLVAFYAGINGDPSVRDDQVIIFDYVRTNIGNGYDTSTGIFTTPTSGVYMFYVNFLTHQHKSIDAMISRNYEDVQRLYAGTLQNRYGPGCNMATLSLNAGDKIYVKVNSDQHSTGSVLDGPWCTFSGFLLYPAK